MAAEGLEKLRQLKDAGFSDQEIAGYEGDTRKQLSDAGFSGQEADDYFGVKNPNMIPFKNYVASNIKAAEDEQAAKSQSSKEGSATEPRKAQTFMEHIEAGLQISDVGLLVRQAKPDLTADENANMFYGIASKVATLAGDAPVMLAGMMAGGAAAGTAAAPTLAIPFVGPALEAGATAAGAAYAGWSAPVAFRKILMDHYEKGDVKDFRDFWERASSTFLEANKAGLTGVATAGVGGVVGKVVGPAAGAMTRTAAVGASEVATMTTVGAALDGHMPAPKDFAENAALLVGIHSISHAATMAGKMRQIYAETGIKPSEVAVEAEKNPALKEQLLSDSKEIPEAFKSAVEPKPELANTIEVAPSPKEEPAPKLSEAEQKIMSQIGDKTETTKPGYSANKLYEDLVDKFDPIKTALKSIEKNGKLPADKDPYILAREYNDYKSKAKHLFEKGTLDFNTLETTGKGLKEIIDPIKEELPNFKAFLASSRALELQGRGIEHGFDLKAAKQVVKEGKAKFGKVAEDLVNYQNENLRYLKDSGFLSEDAYSKMLDSNKMYIPFSRLGEDGAPKGKRGTSQPIKAIRGSDAKIADPLQSVVDNSLFYMKLAEKNRATRSFIELVDKNPSLGSRVEATTKGIKVYANEIGVAKGDAELQSLAKDAANSIAEKAAKYDGKPENKAGYNDVLSLLSQTGGGNIPEEFTIFRKNALDVGEGQIAARINGKLEVRNVDPAVARAFKALDGSGGSQSVFLKLAQRASTALRFGATFTPDFVIKNYFRDQLTSGTFSKFGSMPFASALNAMGDIVGKTDTYYKWLKSGGAGGSFLELDANYAKNDIFQLNKETGFLDQARNIVSKPVHYLKLASELAEQSTRLAEFKKGMQGKEENAANLFAAGFGSREVTVDFTRMGAKMQALNSITAFQNAQIQGADRLARAFKENPQGVTATALASITAPSVMLWYANHDDPRYKNLPQWQKDNFWIIITDKWEPFDENSKEQFPPDMMRIVNGVKQVNHGSIYRLPKPQELGLIFGSLPERALDAFFTANPHAFKDFEKTIGRAMTPNMIPDVAKPFIEQKFNQSLFTDAPVIPHQLEGLLPDLQATEYTSETAKQLGKLIQHFPGMSEASDSIASPVVIDNYIQDWTGAVGKYTIQVIDKALVKAGVAPDPVKPEDTLSDIPFIKAFAVRYPNGGAQPIKDFYDNYKESEKYIKSLKEYEKNGNSEGAMTVMNDHADKLVSMAETKKALGEVSRAIRMLVKDPNTSPHEKRQLIDGMYYQMIEMAGAANKMVEDIKKVKK